MTTPPEGTEPPPGPVPSPGGYGSPPATGPHDAPPVGPYGQGGDPYGAPPGGYGAPPAYGAPPVYGAPPTEGHGALPPGVYGAPVSGVEPRQGPPTDVVSVVGLVLAFLLAPVGLVLSIVGLVRTAGGRRKGRGIAIAGVIVSILMTVLATVAVVALVVLVRDAAEDVGGSLEELRDIPPVTEPSPSLEPPPGDTALPPPVDPDVVDPDVVDPAALLPVGEAAELDGLRLTVTGVDLAADALVAAESADNPPPSGRYVVVSGTVENVSTQEQDVYSGINIAYVSTTGAAHDEFSCGATIAGAAADADPLVPGASADLRWCLDVPVEEVGGGRVQAVAGLGSGSAAWADR